ncbi:ATP-binding cassette domain-containing protein, partial [Microbacterium sp. 69-10]|uniref:ABC transporter ATP-binding protein n=1 Tax=Microbacterium sp. 69-10 TaxID=1895783 RepID=UPI0025E90DB7
MPQGQVLEFNRVTKRFGDVTAVADLSVRVEPGVVTAFLGPNGAGKTTSLRMLLGQIRPTSGTATIGGSAYSELRQPLRSIGAVLEEASYRPRRTAARQLSIAAKANGIPASRVDEVLRLVGLQDDADTRLGSYSLGMRQRLAVASALLGDPGVLVLDEPANGLDPEGIRWMRLLMRRLADEGRTVLVSSHVLSEIEQVADDVVVLSKGRAVFAGSIDKLADPSGGAVIVDAEHRAQLITALSAAKLNFDVLRSGVTVRDSDAATVGAITAAAGVPLTLLQQRGPSLEDVFLDLVYGRRSDSPRLDQVA